MQSIFSSHTPLWSNSHPGTNNLLSFSPKIKKAKPSNNQSTLCSCYQGTSPFILTKKMATSLTLPNRTLASLFPCHTPKTQSSVSQCLPLVSKSSQSQFYGLKFSYSSSLSIPSSSYFKTSISAKVHCFTLCVYWLTVMGDLLMTLGFCRWTKVQCLHHSHWKIRMGKMWAFPSLKESLWLSISTLLMRPLAAQSRWLF